MQPPPKIMVERYVNIIYAKERTSKRSSITCDQEKVQNLDTVLFLSRTRQWNDSDQDAIESVPLQEASQQREKVPGSPDDRIPPYRLTKDQRVGEYGSAIFQAKASYEPFNGRLDINGNSTPSAMMAKDMFRDSDPFKPFPVDTPKHIQ
ncbi:hypothetical protein FALBO_12180 [Fusarium albosuccineum]|uniref:Uncharacterized protein n=1 Tax=Fusarium albosuccineum TaxID=1237068 RepID=A0A8H4L3U3_9HYPO|nr:hypothetical protein FALBO_12180 [Fusarium albosuccineum]